MNALLSFFANLGIPEKDLALFLQHIKVRSYAKNDILCAPGRVDQHLSFLSKGLVRFYVIKDSKESTFDFIFPGSFFWHYDSFYTQRPTRFFSQALADCEMYQISHSDLLTLFDTCLFAKDLSNKAVQKILEKKVTRELSLLMDTQEQRYTRLLHEQPAWVKTIPLKHLASYLGMVPETLSRIRKRIS